MVMVRMGRASPQRWAMPIELLAIDRKDWPVVKATICVLIWPSVVKAVQAFHCGHGLPCRGMGKPQAEKLLLMFPAGSVLTKKNGTPLAPGR